MSKEEIKKKHHYLPRFYLEGFTKLNSNCLWVYEKAGLKLDLHLQKMRGAKNFIMPSLHMRVIKHVDRVKLL